MSEIQKPETHTASNEHEHDGITFEVIEPEHSGDKRIMTSGVYLIPNLITTLSLFSGFYSIILSTSADYQRAGLAILFLLSWTAWTVEQRVCLMPKAPLANNTTHWQIALHLV